MFKHSTTDSTQANNEQELVPLTPEVAREIEKLLDKHKDTLRNLKDHHKTSSERTEAQYRSNPRKE